MSHRATVHVEFKDPDALAEAARAVGATVDRGSVTFYDRSVVSGLRIHLPGWQYPVVVDDQQRAHYDHYNGRWGDLGVFNRFRQAYTVAATTNLARRMGRRVVQTRTEAGHIRLELR